jgi:hypothetical protein
MPSRVRARKVAHFAVVAALGAASIAACTFTTSFDGLRGGVASAEPTDGALPDDSAPTSDSAPPSIDASGADACGPNISADIHNCGACGHDCLGGACIGGVCQPSLLASDQGVPRGLAVVRGNVYWASNTKNTVMRVGTDGSRLTPLLSNQKTPIDMVVRPDGLLLLTGDGAVIHASLDGTGQRTVVPPSASGSTTGRIAAVGDVVYFTNARDKTLSRSDLDGGARATLASGQSSPFGVAANATRVFWSADVDGGGAIQALDVDGTDVTVLASAQATPRTLVLFGSTVYWVTSVASGNVMRAVLLADGGANTSVFASAQNMPWAVVEDADSVYWTTAGVPGAIYACPRAGCGGPPRVVVSGVVQPTYLVTDARAVYVATNGGTILKIAK